MKKEKNRIRKNVLCNVGVVFLAALLFAGCGKEEPVVDKPQDYGVEEGEGTSETAGDEKKSDAGPAASSGESAKEVPDSEMTEKNENFLCGCDISTLIAEEKSGVVYYNEDGEKEDLCKILADHGVNLIRVRIWNDPYDKKGHGYGGGNCDVKNAIKIGKRATKYGMPVMIDFHYSDFWADPSKQMCPKAWEGMKIAEKADALYRYTMESLTEILDAGVDVSMVQVGNETTTGLSGETEWENIAKLMKAGSKAVREISEKYGKEIKVVIQFTNPENTESYDSYASELKKYEVDYDVFASSYYPYWHGTLENLKDVLKNVIDGYGKEVMVAEISYHYTYEDGDGHTNVIYDGAWGEFNYEVSEEGQIQAVTECADAVKTLGKAGLGICYWEPAWLPVPAKSDKARKKLWEKYGSGWASSYAGDYDPDDAGENYGGDAWDNQALFDFTGHPLKSLGMFQKIRE